VEGKTAEGFLRCVAARPEERDAEKEAATSVGMTVGCLLQGWLEAPCDGGPTNWVLDQAVRRPGTWVDGFEPRGPQATSAPMTVGCLLRRLS
jgi:hypothetical protein